MKIFSSHRKKLDPKRRYGGREFQNKVKAAADYKRVFSMHERGSLDKMWRLVGLRSKFWRRLGFIILIVAVYYLAVSTRLIISEFTISGNSQVQTQQILDVILKEGEKRLFLVKQAHFLLLTHGRVNEILTENIPTIKEVAEYKRTWPNRAELVVIERTPGFAVKSNEKYFLIDDEGTVVKPLDEPGNLLVAEDSVVESFATKESFPNPKMAPFIISMARAWPAKLTSTISLVKFPGKSSEEVQFISSEGWAVFFDINRSVSSQLDSLVLLLTKQIPIKDRVNLAYIDLRLDKWAYYCYKNSPCVENPQEQEETELNASE